MAIKYKKSKCKLYFLVSIVDNTEQVEIRDQLNILRIAKLLQVKIINLKDFY